MIVRIEQNVGDFAEDKDAAARLRKNEIVPSIAKNHEVTIDFSGVRLATQSFVHALISEILRTGGEDVLKLITFKGCSKLVRGIIETVVQYSLESTDDADQ